MKIRSLFTAFILFTFSQVSLKAQSQEYPFKNYKLSFEERVNDLVGRLTLEEKVAQLLNSAPAIPRLGIPAYDWWNETLHGVARTPYNVSVFPQAIGMAATFNKDALFKMADICALEGRAVYNKSVAAGKAGAKYQGLTYWTPNINIFRDPRWGRGQETYGEDPYLTAMLGDAFVRGLQGDDPKYIKAAACAKHYAVHSGPEPMRHNFNAEASAYDLWDTYLPAFRKLVVDSKVVGVMCAYNAFRTQPCCASDILLTDILRSQWNFKGYVTSDCGAIDDFYKKHKTHPDAEAAAVDAVFHGTDVDCGKEAYFALVQGVKNNKISEKQIDVSLKRLFMVRFQLGLFDPVELVKYAQTPASVLESPDHKEHALTMARQSIVLLKNDNLLPLSKKIKKIVVLGPNADNRISILGNYNGNPSKLSTVLDGIKEKLGANAEVVYEKAINYTNADLLQSGESNIEFKFDGKSGFQAEYFNNVELKGQPVAKRLEPKLNHVWQEGEIVLNNLNANDFSARYTSSFTATSNRLISFELDADNGYRLFINGQLAIESWASKRKEVKRYKLAAKKDSTYKLVVEFWQGDGGAHLKLNVGDYIKTDFDALISRYKDADVFLFAGGISPELEGESMRVDDPGFSGGDRTSIMLPAVQTELLKALKASGKPVVFVMMTGSAIAIPWEADNLPAIVNAWYGGQAAGTAIADVLFGDYNPSGRLPITFYKGDADLAAFTDYNMDNRTYRYFKGQPLYSFGYGLSYTKFKYDMLQVPATAKKGQNVAVSVRVTNNGKVDGDEIVQLYTMNKGDHKAPLKALKGFERISLKAGQSKLVKFTLTPADLSLVKEDGSSEQFSGNIGVSVGGSQPGEQKITSGNLLYKVISIK